MKIELQENDIKNKNLFAFVEAFNNADKIEIVGYEPGGTRGSFGDYTVRIFNEYGEKAKIDFDKYEKSKGRY